MLIGISFGLTVLNATEATVIGTHITTIGIGGYLLIRRLSIGRTYINLKYWRYATILSIPLIGHLLSSLILSRADQILIQSIIGSAETGIYSLAYRVGELPNLVLTSIGSVWSVWFFDRMANRDNKVIRKYSTLYVLGIAVTIIGVMIVGPFFYRIITPPIYWEGIPLIPVVATGFIWFVMYSVIGLVEQFEKKNTYRAVATLVAAIFNITANIILLPIFGYQIAAWTTVASYAVMFVLHVLVILFVLKKRDLLNLPVFFVIGSITTIIAYGFYNVY
jgi:O-antigen/teichoic acid export membrane protein